MKIADLLKERLKRIFQPAGSSTLEPSAELTSEKQIEVLNDRTNESSRFIASFSQEGLWLLNQLHPASSAHNLQFGLRLKGHLDREALQSSLQELASRHDTLRTRFELEETQLSQVILANHSVHLPIEDLSHLPEPDRYSAAYQLAVLETRTPFDLSRVPLFRLKLIQLASDDHILTCVIDHIISDGWSIGLFVEELATLYDAFALRRPSPLPSLLIQYGDYARSQREWLTPELLDSQTEYWREKLRGAPSVLHINKTLVRPSVQSVNCAAQALTLPVELVRDLKKLAARHNATPFMITFAAFTILLSQYSGQEDLLIGVPVAGRNRVETEPLIGLFVNMVVLRTNLAGNPMFCDLLGQVRAVTLEALCNSDIPFRKLVEALNPVRSPSYHPIFQVIFQVIKSAVRSERFGALTASPYFLANTASPYDLTMNLIESNDGNWTAQLEYNTELFDAGFITGMLKHYISVLRAAVDDARLHIADLTRVV